MNMNNNSHDDENDTHIQNTGSIIRNLSDHAFHTNHLKHNNSKFHNPGSIPPPPPPLGLEAEYRKLHNMLYQSLYEGSNCVALLMGPRGHGKRLVLERCLASLRRDTTRSTTTNTTNSRNSNGSSKEESRGRETTNMLSCTSFRTTGTTVKKNVSTSTNGNDEDETKFFRIVRVHGLMVHGDDSAAAREMVRQLSTNAALDTPNNSNSNSNNNHQHNNDMSKAGTKAGIVSQTSSFHSNISLLDESLKRARIDGIPILVILSDLDAFAASTRKQRSNKSNMSSQGSNNNNSSNPSSSSSSSSTNKQILLYHLLDRAASDHVHLCVVGMTSRLTLDQMLEKRIRSRAVGTQVTIKFLHVVKFEDLVALLVDKLKPHCCGDHDNNDDDNNSNSKKRKLEAPQLKIHTQLQNMLLSTTNNSQEHITVQTLFRRSHALGKDIRYFQRVLTVAIAMMDNSPTLTPQHLLQGLASMGCDITLPNNHTTTTNSTAGTRTITSLPINNRTKTLLSLPGSQIAILLSIKRLMIKEKCRDTNTALGGTYTHPFTCSRIYREYEHYKRSTSFKNDVLHTRHVFILNVLYLVECDLIKFAYDHNGGGGMQYEYSHSIVCGGDDSGIGLLGEQNSRIMNAPLHMTLEVDGELSVALQNGLLDCSTGLRDWGSKKF